MPDSTCADGVRGQNWRRLSKPYQRFEAQCCPSDLGDGFLEGTVFFTPLALRFESGEAAREIPRHHLTAALAPDGAERIYFSDPQQPGLRITTTDLEILDEDSVPQLAALREAWSARLTRIEMARRLKLVAGFFLIGGLLLWLGQLAVGLAVRSVVGQISPEFERKWGDGQWAEFQRDEALADDTNAAARLATLAEPLLRALPAGQTAWQFHVVEDASPNAFALPGGHIVVCTGLLHLAQSPEEVLGAVAHELAHVIRKHGFRKQVSSAGPGLVFSVLMRGRGGALGLLAGGSALLVQQSFSQEYETEADESGWEYLVKANIDPRGMIELFRKFQNEEAKEKHGLAVPKAFHSHPGLDKRIQHLEARWKKLRRQSGFVELDGSAVIGR